VDRRRRGALIAALAAVLAGCGDDARPSLTRAELLDPETCRDCHPQHVEEWESSMHAYASDDPVFRAMNARGQEEAELEGFCVACHAPMAVAENATTDGLNLDELPTSLKGVTCFYCHTVASVGDDHNNGLALADADDLAMRGPFGNAVANPAHRTAYSPLHDRNNQESSALCGSCHDIVTPAGVELERTYREWQDSFFSRPQSTGGLSCGNCHMVGHENEVVADFEGVGTRTRHEHTFPGVDTALTPWPGVALQREQIARDLEPAIGARLCVNPSEGGRIEYRLDNVGGGHMLPSGASSDRRMWVQLVAEAGEATILSSGIVAADQSVEEVAQTDPLLWQIRDFATDADGAPAHMFWDVRDVRSELLRPAVTFDPSDPAFDHSTTRVYPLGGGPLPTRVEAVVFLRAIDHDFVDDLIESGHLDSSVGEAISTIEIRATRQIWTQELAGADGCVP
jgi:hypothetical protein